LWVGDRGKKANEGAKKALNKCQQNRGEAAESKDRVALSGILSINDFKWIAVFMKSKSWF